MWPTGHGPKIHCMPQVHTSMHMIYTEMKWLPNGSALTLTNCLTIWNGVINVCSCCCCCSLISMKSGLLFRSSIRLPHCSRFTQMLNRTNHRGLIPIICPIYFQIFAILSLLCVGRVNWFYSWAIPSPFWPPYLCYSWYKIPSDG